MAFSTENMVEFQEREEAARLEQLIPAGKYNWEIEVAEVTEVNGLPRLRVQHRIEGSNTGQLGRVHSEFFNWYASENSASPKPIEERERGLRGMVGRKLDAYIKALATCPTSTQELGESFVDCVNGLRAADDTAEVEEYMTAIGNLLEGQFITGTIRHSNTGWANLHAEKYDMSIGAADKVAV